MIEPITTSEKSVLVREKSANIRKSWSIEEINKWVTRMERFHQQNGGRSIGGPRKRWWYNLEIIVG